MISKQESDKRKCKFGGTKVCKAEEVRKYFANPKIESFWLVCKLYYLQFGFQTYRSSRLQMFFEAVALKHLSMLKFRFNKIADFQACNFIKKRLQQKQFSVTFSKEWLALSVAASGNILWTFFLLHMRMMNRIIAWNFLAPQGLFYFIACVSFLFISFFLSYFLVDFTTFLGIEVSLSILERKQWSCS